MTPEISPSALPRITWLGHSTVVLVLVVTQGLDLVSKRRKPAEKDVRPT